MKITLFLIIFLLPITCINFAAQPPLSLHYWGIDKVELKHRNAQELMALNIGSESGVIVTSCWNENSVIVSAPSDKLQSVIAYIKMQVDVPHAGPDGRAISK